MIVIIVIIIIIIIIFIIIVIIIIILVVIVIIIIIIIILVVIVIIVITIITIIKSELTTTEMSHCGSYKQTAIFAFVMKIRFLCSSDMNYLFIGQFCSTVSMVNMNRLRTVVVRIKYLCITMISPPFTTLAIP